MRARLTTASELVGAALVTIGAVLMWLPAGIVVGGLLLIGIGWLLGRDVA